MTAPTISLPGLDCPPTILPDPANLSNLFGGLATHAYRYDIEELKETLEDIRTLIGNYDPKFKKIELPEKEWDIMVTRMVSEYSTYVQDQILRLIASLTPIEFNVTILGITFNLQDVIADPSSIKASIAEDIESYYNLIPAEFRVYEKFDTAELKAEAVWDYIRSEMQKKMNLLIHGGFGALIDLFDEIWDALGLPSLPALETIDIKALIKDKSLEELEKVQVFGFSLTDLLGGDIENNLQIDEYDKERLIRKAREFAEEWQMYLIKQWMEKVTAFFDAIGLSALTQWFTFNFCDFLTLLGFPTQISLPSSVTTVINTAQSALPNATTVEESV